MSAQEHLSDPDQVAEAVEFNFAVESASENEAEVNFSTGRGVVNTGQEPGGSSQNTWNNCSNC